MGTHKRRCRYRPALYASVYPALKVKAQQCGYALLIHGSMRRDMDLVAVPWMQSAKAKSTLAKRLAKVIGGYVAEYRKQTKPHGRHGYVITMSGGAYIDLSIMPRRCDWNTRVKKRRKGK